MKKTIVFAMMMPLFFLVMSCQKEVATEVSRDVELNKSDKAPVWVATIQLSGEEEVPSNDLKANGVAILRVTGDKMLHSMVIVETKEEVGGMLTAAHIHEAPAGTNGSVRIFLCHNAEDFGELQHTQLTDEQYNMLMDESKHFYVNAHSTVKPGGLVRGQIR